MSAVLAPRCASGADPLRRLDALVDWERAPRGAMRADLGPVRDLLERLGDPQRALRIVHVTGTKGKGSVCALIEAGLLNAGLRAGRYASPHVERLNERICVLGRPVDDGALRRALRCALDARDAAVEAGSAGAAATWFDVVTAAAFVAFRDAGLAWAVVEVGLGGRLDSTNVVLPELAVITNVELEHCEVLGATRQAIAREKAGIAKPGRPLLCGLAANDPAGQAVAAVARREAALPQWSAAAEGEGWRGRNLALAREALAILSRCGIVGRAGPLSAGDLPERVAAAVRLPARLEAFEVPQRGGAVKVVVDGAHVAFAVSAALAEMREGPWVVVLGLGADKDGEAIVEALHAAASHVVCTSVGGEAPCVDPLHLAALCRARGLPCTPEPAPAAALARALALAGAGGRVFVVGSFKLAGVLRPALKG